ncbi:MAG: hypothetical protein ACT6RD_03485 [Brevundimonas sp.]|uniref:hypothetical protein n=1 Tax=Brevundimonas sp. TaxID=1871086 RepID=UPI004034EAAD
MRPPWSEAAVLLSAHNFTPPPPDGSRRRNFWGLKPMPRQPFALFKKADASDANPSEFATLAQLAARIERKRADRAIQLEEVENLEFQGDRRLHVGVQVWALDMANEKDELIGLAWLDGKGRSPLDAALRRVRAHHDRRAAA